MRWMVITKKNLKRVIQSDVVIKLKKCAWLYYIIYNSKYIYIYSNNKYIQWKSTVTLSLTECPTHKPTHNTEEVKIVVDRRFQKNKEPHIIAQANDSIHFMWLRCDFMNIKVSLFVWVLLKVNFSMWYVSLKYLSILRSEEEKLNYCSRLKFYNNSKL